MKSFNRSILLPTILMFAAMMPFRVSVAAALPLNDTWVQGGQDIVAGNFFTGSWSWNSTQEVKFTITDYHVIGDRFEVYDNGSLVFTTSAVPDWSAHTADPFDPLYWTSDPETAYNSGLFSGGSFVFGAGSHDITIRVIDIPMYYDYCPFPDSTFAIKASVVPEPSTYILFGLGLIGLIAVRRRRQA